MVRGIEKEKAEDTTNNNMQESGCLAPEPKFSLAEVKENVGRLYLEINMFDIADDTSIHKVYISRDCIKELHKFFTVFTAKDNQIYETGCFIIGRWDYAQNSNQQTYDISLEYIVTPGSDAVYEKERIVFGTGINDKMWYAIEKYTNKFDTEFVCTSWMHSHPGYGLALSPTDIDTQEFFSFSSPKRMLAIVVNTKSPNLETAFFSPKTSKKNEMNNKKDIKKTLSLDELLKWAETPYIEQKKTEQINYEKSPECLFQMYIQPDTSKEERKEILKIMKERDIDFQKTKEDYIESKQASGKNTLVFVIIGFIGGIIGGLMLHIKLLDIGFGIILWTGFILAIVQLSKKLQLTKEIQIKYYNKSTRTTALISIITFVAMWTAFIIYFSI